MVIALIVTGMEHLPRPRYHHILFSKRLWRAQLPTLQLRENQWLKPPLEDDSHAALHRAVSIVPVPDWCLAEQIKKHFEPVEGDYLASADQLLFAIETALRSPRIDTVQRSLGQLAVYAIDLQRPFVQEGLIWLPEAA